MKEFFLKIYDYLSERKGLTATALSLLLVLSLFLISRMHYEEDITAFLPSDETSEKYTSVYNSLGGEDKIAVFFHMEEPDTDMMIEAMDRFEQVFLEEDTEGMVPGIKATVDEDSVYDIFDLIGQNYPYFLKPADFERIDSLLSIPGYVEEKIAEDKRTVLLPSAGMMTENVAYDPLGLFTPVLQRLQNLDPTGGSTLIDGYLFTEDLHRGIVFFTSPFGEAESGRNSELVDLLDKVQTKTMQEFPEVTISSIGGPVIAVANSSRIKMDSVISVAVALVLILLVLYLSFKRFSDIFWIAFSILCGSVLALALVALFKDSISIIVLGIGSIIIGIAVNYPLHYIDHLKHEPNKREALKEMVPPLLVGNVTTVSAFLALFLLKAKALHDFGLVGAMVLVGTIVFSLIFLPALAPQKPAAKGTVRLDFDRHVTLSPKQRKYLFMAFVLVTLVLSYFGSKTSFDSDMHHINYMTESQAKDLDILSSLEGDDPSTDNIYMVTADEDFQRMLSNNEAMLSAVDGPEVLSISTLGDFIPSKVRQQDIFLLWDRLWERYPDVVPRMEKAMEESGFRKGAFSYFTDLVTEKDHEIQDEDFFEPIVSALGSTFILDGENGQKKMVNFIKVSSEESDSIKASWKQDLESESQFFFNSKDVSSKLVSLLSDDFNYVGFLCGFIVFFFLWVSFSSLELSLLSFLPLAVSWLWILGLMNLTGVQFNIVNIILATFIFGQGDDYTIFITEGLMYEYAYGKKILSSYKNSVALSAIIMFIGIGALILAKHPAMKSLAQVTIIGMLSVVLMAYYLPPLVFRWITTKGGKKREVPLTIGRLLRSLFSIVFFIVLMILVTPAVAVYFLVGKDSDGKRLKYHKFLQKMSGFIINHVPGTNYSMSNEEGEKFDKPAVIICNHQSHLDIMALMALTPKIVVLTKDWVWKNPLYGALIRYAEFYPMSDGVDVNLDRMRSLVSRGYSIVVFPEGTRTETGSVGRFHRGAFLLAEQLQIDILPMYIHGFDHVLPKTDFMLRKADMYLEVGKRISPSDMSMGEDFKIRTKAFHHQYIERLEKIASVKENAQYSLPFVKAQYMYKGSDIMADFRRQTTVQRLFEIDAFDSSASKEIHLSNCGCGAYAFLFAKVHKDVTVYAEDPSEENVLLVNNCCSKPDNLIFTHRVK